MYKCINYIRINKTSCSDVHQGDGTVSVPTSENGKFGDQHFWSDTVSTWQVNKTTKEGQDKSKEQKKEGKEKKDKKDSKEEKKQELKEEKQEKIEKKEEMKDSVLLALLCVDFADGVDFDTIWRCHISIYFKDKNSKIVHYIEALWHWKPAPSPRRSQRKNPKKMTMDQWRQRKWQGRSLDVATKPNHISLSCSRSSFQMFGQVGDVVGWKVQT